MDAARERVEFLADARAPRQVRPAIAASWRRSRDSGVLADRVQVPYVHDPDVDTPLTRSAEPVLQRLFERLRDKAVSIILTDAAGLVLSRRTHDADFERRLDRVLLAPGFSFAEKFVGTNGIGTALEAGSATLVLGHEHYAENLEMFACAAVPIHDRVAQRLAGVMNLTCRRGEADPLLLALAETTAEQIEQALRADLGQRELEVLHAYRQTCRRSSGLVLAVTADAVTVNDRARTELAPADQEAVLAQAGEVGAALAAGARRSVDVVLPSGAPARLAVHCVRGDGLVVQVRPAARPAAAVRLEPLPGLAGASPRWRQACRAVDECVQGGVRVAVVGEPGVGKLAAVRGALRGRSTTVVDVLDDGWGEQARAAGGALVVRHADRADRVQLRAALADRDGFLALTAGPGFDDELVGRVVEAPPLRLRRDDVPELVEFFLRGSALTCSAAALRVLLRAPWPGNVAQLRQVLLGAGKRSGQLQPADLPPELHALTRRVLSPLETIERDAIVQAIADAGGNKPAAATTLGISRATIYRKIREYGIVNAG